MKNVETRGLVLFSRNYREQDKLVKIFTESFGKRMFFVKNASKSKFSSSLQNFTQLDLLGTMNDDGLSFISDVSDARVYKYINSDAELLFHAAGQLAGQAASEGFEIGKGQQALEGLLALGANHAAKV